MPGQSLWSLTWNGLPALKADFYWDGIEGLEALFGALWSARSSCIEVVFKVGQGSSEVFVVWYNMAVGWLGSG